MVAKRIGRTVESQSFWVELCVANLMRCTRLSLVTEETNPHGTSAEDLQLTSNGSFERLANRTGVCQNTKL
jgi:hypothetical protein